MDKSGTIKISTTFLHLASVPHLAANINQLWIKCGSDLGRVYTECQQIISQDVDHVLVKVSITIEYIIQDSLHRPSLFLQSLGEIKY